MTLLCRSQNNSQKRPATHAIQALAATFFIASGASVLAWAALEPSVPYTVKPSDKLIVVSRQLLTRPSEWKEVARFNGMKNPNVLRAGQVIHIPLRLMPFLPAAGKIVSTSGDVQLAGSQAAVGQALAEGGRLHPGPTARPWSSWATAAASRCCPTRWP